MKSKRVILVHSNIGSIQNISAIHTAFRAIVNEMIDEGRVIKEQTDRLTRFEDGTVIEKVQVGTDIYMSRVTHLYIDEELLKLGNSVKYIKDALIPTVVPEGNYEKLDVEGSTNDRIFIIGLEKGVAKWK